MESEGIPSGIIRDDARGMKSQLHFTQGVFLVAHESNWEHTSEILSSGEESIIDELNTEMDLNFN